jgi:hypothetical protein
LRSSKPKRRKRPAHWQRSSARIRRQDRIDKARLLLTRFPDREEYTVSTSEFNIVKQKLLAIVNQNNLGNNTEKAAPTLKRKPSRGSSNGNEGESEKDPPTLKRKPGSAPDND